MTCEVRGASPEPAGPAWARDPVRESPRSSSLKAQIDRALRDFVREETALLVAVDPLLAPVAEQLESSLADGKRLRAAFCYWGWRAVGQPDDAALVRAAASMELVHAAAVVHDDLIDDSSLRHGRATAHVALRDAVGAGPARHAARPVARDAGG